MTSNQNVKHHEKKKKRWLIIYSYIIIVLLILTTSSAYAWMRLTATPRVSNLAIYVNSFSGMEISTAPTGENWSQQISCEELFSEEYELRPATWSDKDQTFYGANYSINGKIQDKWDILTDEMNANNTTQSNYYCIANFYAHTGARTQVSLAPAISLNDGSDVSGTYLMGKPEWNESKIRHENMGKGAENAIRIAINIIRLDSEYNSTGEEEFFIYEPNANAHNDGTFGYLQTPSIDGAPSLIEQEKIITQSLSRWGDTDPVQRGVLYHHTGDFYDTTNLFTMEADETVQIRIIIWLEGNDVDCTNAISDAAIIANLQFDAQTIDGAGLVPIPKDTNKNN